MSAKLRNQLLCILKDQKSLADQLAALQAEFNALNEVDDQTIALAGNILTLSGGLVPDTSIDLTPFLDNTDDQAISLAGNVLTLEDGGTVDLTPFLDNTDNQQIQNFSLAGTVVTLTLEDGGTVTVDLASIDTDDQTLALAGTILTIADGNSVDLASVNTDNQTITAFNLSPTGILTLTISGGNTVTVDLTSLDADEQTLALAANLLTISNGNTVDLSAYLDNTDEQVLSTTVVGGVTASMTISNGNTVPIVHPPAQTLTTTTAIIRSEEYFARTIDGLVQSSNRNLTITNTGIGQWTAVLSPPHPDGANYHVSMTTEEQSANRDTPDVTIVQGSQSASGFQLQVTTGDNGAGADNYVSAPLTIAIDSPVTVVTGVSLV